MSARPFDFGVADRNRFQGMVPTSENGLFVLALFSVPDAKTNTKDDIESSVIVKELLSMWGP